MRILVLGSSETLVDDPTYYEKYVAFARAASPDSSTIDVNMTLFEDLHIAIGEGSFIIRCLRNNCDIAEYDLVLVRGRAFRRYMDMLKTLSVYVNLHRKVIINDHTDYRSGSKLDQAVTFYTERIRTPLTVVVTASLVENEQETPNLSFPCIMKSTYGAHGLHNHVVHNWSEVRAIQTEHPKLRFILQRFITNEGDYRLLIIGDEMVAIKRRARKGLHLNNTSQGGKATLTPLEELPKHIIANAWRLVRRLKLITAGVDVLQDSATGEYYMLEVNSQPQLMSGTFLETKVNLFAKYLQRLQG